ncbi:hypothetical protein [Lyngbya sp. CCY1209]|uniref:hypothetical protein n=1 Tax=Lyngbya sp. CCY1209 TaxID=2886103 RepID=UPI002D1FC4E9|nr:hypothetical protein [Lyngbya sp. CCY1209]MEB3883795.1 hypothetical protein [Lyngbya sp. CCY1209]
MTDLTHSNYLPPEMYPLERLIVRDGLLLNAERWKRSHDYHRRRQNLHYQSLYHPGIVRGLGVCAIEAPSDISAQYRDGRWVQIQPGMAIDRLGNPIIVDRPIEFRIASVAETEMTAVYLVLSYVDPETLHRQTDEDWAAETFRIDEKNHPPASEEIELCRIAISADAVQIRPAKDVFDPDINELDLRYRVAVQARSPQTVRVAQILGGTAEDIAIGDNLTDLLESVSVLAPQKMGVEPLEEIAIWREFSGYEMPEYSLIYIRYPQIFSWGELEYNYLKQYSDRGAVLFIEASSREVNIADINSVMVELQQAIEDIQLSQISDLKLELQSELTTCETEIDGRLEIALEPIKNLAHHLEISLSHSGKISRDDPIKTRPFLFSELPVINREPIRLFNWGQIILSVGCLSSGWGLSHNLPLPRETIRSAQELGINILHFSGHRSQLSRLQMNANHCPL